MAVGIGNIPSKLYPRLVGGDDLDSLEGKIVNAQKYSIRGEYVGDTTQTANLRRTHLGQAESLNDRVGQDRLVRRRINLSRDVQQFRVIGGIAQRKQDKRCRRLHLGVVAVANHAVSLTRDVR